MATGLGFLDRLRGRPASLRQALGRFALKEARPEAWNDLLEPFENDSIEDEAVAKALAQCLARVPQWPLAEQRYAERSWSHPLHGMLAFFQGTSTQEGARALSVHALPEVRRLVDDGLQRPGADLGTLVFALKQLVLYRQAPDTDRVLAALNSALHPALQDEYFWTTALDGYEAGHAQAASFFDRARQQLPGAFAAVALLDAANAFWREESPRPAQPHPFDTAEGRARLASWLGSTDPDKFSYAHSATAALPFLQHPDASPLFELATRHADADVRMEADWASLHAQQGDTQAALARLVSASESPLTHAQAAGYLRELGLGDHVPATTRGSDFQAVAEMATWLQHPQEFGAPPDELRCVDRRTLFWPPTHDMRDLHVMRDVYRGRNEDGSDDVGHGLVGSITFALFGETDSADVTPVDVLASHCGWEMATRRQDDYEALDADERRAAGMRLLRQHNAGSA